MKTLLKASWFCSFDVHRGGRYPLVIAILMLAASVIARPMQDADGAPPALQSLVIVPEAASVDEGAEAVFVAIVTYSNGARKNVSGKARWSSSDRKVATVSGDGTAAGMRGGKVTIKAAIGKVEARGELTIRPRLAMLRLDPGSITLAPGESYAFTVRGRYSDGTRDLLTSKATWSIDGSGTATISAHGRATAVRRGMATIVAEVLGLRATAEMQVVETPVQPEVPVPVAAPAQEAIWLEPVRAARPAFLTAISIDPPAESLPTRETKRLTAWGRYSDGTVRDITEEAIWASTDVQVATVHHDGTVYGVRFGTATIAATLQTFSGVASMTITPIIAHIDIVPEAIRLKHRADVRVQAVATLTDDTRHDVTDDVTWASSDAGVVSVSSGSIRAQAPGSATVIATLDGSRTSAAVTVVPVIESIDIQPRLASLTVGQTQQLTATAALSDGSTKDVTGIVTWIRDSAAVAVTSAGLVMAIAEGSANVVARLDSVEGAAVIGVSKPAQSIVSTRSSPAPS